MPTTEMATTADTQLISELRSELVEATELLRALSRLAEAYSPSIGVDVRHFLERQKELAAGAINVPPSAPLAPGPQSALPLRSVNGSRKRAAEGP
jgi:hypothetical protein